MEKEQSSRRRQQPKLLTLLFDIHIHNSRQEKGGRRAASQARDQRTHHHMDCPTNPSNRGSPPNTVGNGLLAPAKSLHQWTGLGPSIMLTTCGPTDPPLHHIMQQLYNRYNLTYSAQDNHQSRLHTNPTSSPAGKEDFIMERDVFCAAEGTNPAHSLRILLLRAGIESNPGPTSGRAAGKPCDTCEVKIKKAPGRPEEDASHFKCADECGSVCHMKQECSHIPRGEWGVTPWRCPTHRPSSSPPVQQHQNRSAPPQPVNERCPACNKPQKKNPIVCTICHLSYHQAERCSGLKNRYRIRAARSSWECKQCKHPTSQQQPVNQSSSRSQSPKPPCYACKSKVSPGYLVCKSCGAAAHQKCSDLDTRGAIENAKKNKDWECRICLEQNLPPDEPPSTTDSISQKSEPKSAKRRNRPLRIVQWNAEGVNTKMGELREFIKEYKIDVVLIQESKLTEKKSSPVLKDFSVVRGDRKGAAHHGGGLLTYISKELTFKENGHSQRGVVELLSVSIHQSGTKWITINNLYIPPRDQADLSWIPVQSNSVYAGDFNGHSQIWDEIQPTDARGEQILDWVLENDLQCMNDGSPTRLNPGTGGFSTPDVTLVTPELGTKTKWTVIEETAMGSDHSPIVIEIKDGDIQTISTTPFRTKWKAKNVDYGAFREEVKSHFPYDHSHLSNYGRAAVFGDILVEAGKAHVGKTKPSKTKFASNPKVKALVKKRNRLRKQVATRRTEWIEARKEARDAREEAKVEAWAEFVETLEVDEDVNKVWRVIKSLDGTPTSSAPNEALLHKGKTITTNKAKADTFAKNYAQVSSLSFSKDERTEIRNVKKSLDKQPDEATCPPLTMRELKHALRKMKRKGAPGADDIPPAFLKELGPKALTELLAIFNLSFLNADIPQQWRHAIIIPLLKAGKAACDVDSYRPISLTSCVVKLLERMISNRLYTMAENNNWIVNQQAGFRRGLCCEDQIIRLVQKVSDGFQLKPPLRTVMALLDYSKAYDRTWRERLLAKMMKMGVPMTITRWVAAFLRTRSAEVMMNGVLSSRVRMKQGLPQGSVLSPLLFIIFINDIIRDLPDEVIASLFADDAAVYAMDTKLVDAEKKLQKAITVIEKWSLDNKLDLNIKKSCTFFFTNDPNEASWRPNISLMKNRMPFGEGEKEKSPKFLGVRLDRTLCFKDHVEEVCERVNKRCRMLSCLASRSWG